MSEHINNEIEEVDEIEYSEYGCNDGFLNSEFIQIETWKVPPSTSKELLLQQQSQLQR